MKKELTQEEAKRIWEAAVLNSKYLRPAEIVDTQIIFSLTGGTEKERYERLKGLLTRAAEKIPAIDDIDVGQYCIMLSHAINQKRFGSQ